VELKQVSQGWHTLYVRAYSAGDPTAKESVACFTVPYASVGSGDRLKLTVEPDEPFAELLMKVDRDADGEYEESWIPDATVYGSAANDNKASTTTARREVMPNGETAVVLEHEHVGDSDAAAAGVGITYYYVNDDGPAIYTGPIPVDDDDTIEYLSLDRAGNIESSQETSVNRLMDEGGAKARRLPAAHPG
jgi:hypothetical protein